MVEFQPTIEHAIWSRRPVQKKNKKKNMICQLKQRDNTNKGNDYMDVPSVEEVSRMTIYPLIEYMGFGTDVSDGVAKMRAATILGDIFHLHQHTKNLLKDVHTNSKYGHIFSIPASDTQESFSRSAREKVWVDKILLHSSGRKDENKAAMAQYLSKYLFDNYQDERNFSTSQGGLPVSTSMKPE